MHLKFEHNKLIAKDILIAIIYALVTLFFYYFGEKLKMGS